MSLSSKCHLMGYRNSEYPARMWQECSLSVNTIHETDDSDNPTVANEQATYSSSSPFTNN